MARGKSPPIVSLLGLPGWTYGACRGPIQPPDLASVAALCSRVAILQRGGLVKRTPTGEIFRAPRHEHTRQLIGALPRLPAESSDWPVPAT